MNAVRGLAALAVVLAHAVQVFIARITGTDNLFVIATGQIASQGVYIFFIVSGYLITQSILKNYRRNGNVFDAAQYFVARISRIYPPLIFAIALTYGIKFMIEILNINLAGSTWASPEPLRLPGDLYQARERFTIEDGGIKNALLMNNGMLQANGPLWSLCIEWRIYLVAGAVALTLSCKNYIAKIILAIITIFTFIKLRKVNDQYALYTCVWVIGSAISFYKFRYGNLAIPRFVRVVMIVAISASLAYPEYLLGTVTNKTADGFAFQLLLCIAWVCFIFPLEPKLITRFNALLMKLGECSYTLFIIHFPIMLGMLSISIKTTGHNLGTAFIISIFSVAVSLLISHHAAKYVENKVAIAPYVQWVITSSVIFTFHIKNKFYNSK